MKCLGPRTTPLHSPRAPKPKIQLAGGVLCLLFAGAVVATEPQTSAEVTPSAEAVAAPAAENPPQAAGLRVFVDPRTGELTATPTAEQAAALAKSLEETLSRSSEGLEPFALVQGGSGVYLQQRFQSALIARVDGDGSLSYELSCVDNAEHADHVLDSSSSQTAQEWVEK